MNAENFREAIAKEIESNLQLIDAKECAEIVRRFPLPVTERKIAPVQGFSAGIPWDMHLRAYDAYSKRWRPQQALIEGECRGGFSVGELDSFIPGWREELSVRAALERKVAELQESLRWVIKEADEWYSEHCGKVTSITSPLMTTARERAKS